MNDKNEIKICKVFFIICNKSNLNYELQCSLSSNEGMKNLDNVFFDNTEPNKIIYVFSFDFFPKELKNKEAQSKKYKSIINLIYNNIKYVGTILFKETKNNFIYEMQIEEKQNNNRKNINNEIILELNELEKLKIYAKVLKKLKIKQGDTLSLDLILDSQVFLMGKNATYYLDFYLEIFKQCYSRKEVKTLLMMFKLGKVKLPKDINIKNYSSILNSIEKNPNIITKYCSQNDNKEKYFKAFYTLLLYFKANYEKEKIQDLLNNKEVWKYYIEILPNNHQFYLNIELPHELIIEIFRRQMLSFDIIKGTLSYISSNKNKLETINNNRDLIFIFCIKNKVILKILDLVVPSEVDNLYDIILEIGKIINYELEKNKQFVSFNEEFWKKYLEFNVNKTLERKKLIRNAILICTNIDKDLDIKNFELNFEADNKELIIQNPAQNNKEKEKNIIERRLLMPTIGNVSVGKSYFLNAILLNRNYIN